ncbi:unnamed protein product, partial [Brenthis ino]
MSILGIEDLKDIKILRQIFAEFLGTFLYLSISLLAGTSLGAGAVATALANGLLVASVIQIIGQVSGGHINPAVTIGVLTCGCMKIMKAILYITAQILGSILGSLVAYAIVDSSSRNALGATIPYSELRAYQILILEFITTFILVAVVLSVVDRKGLRNIAPIAIGLSITGCQCSAVLYSGSLNPVRSLGPAVAVNIWTHHWVYWVGPLLGGFLAGLTHKYIFNTNASTVNIIENE